MTTEIDDLASATAGWRCFENIGVRTTTPTLQKFVGDGRSVIPARAAARSRYAGEKLENVAVMFVFFVSIQ